MAIICTGCMKPSSSEESSAPTAILLESRCFTFPIEEMNLCEHLSGSSRETEIQERFLINSFLGYTQSRFV